MVAKRWVTSAVWAPIRAAAVAASQPAWPPPITMTSNEFFLGDHGGIGRHGEDLYRDESKLEQ